MLGTSCILGNVLLTLVQGRGAELNRMGKDGLSPAIFFPHKTSKSNTSSTDFLQLFTMIFTALRAPRILGGAN